MQFLRRGDNWITRGKTSQSRVLREPTNSTRISCRVWKPNPGHIGGRRVLSPRRYHCSPNNNVIRIWFRTHWTDKICLAFPKTSTTLVSVKFSIRQPWAHWDTAKYLITTSVNHTEKINKIACALFVGKVTCDLRSHGLMVILNLFDRLCCLSMLRLVF